MFYVLKHKYDVGTNLFIQHLHEQQNSVYFHRKYSELNSIRSASAQTNPTLIE